MRTRQVALAISAVLLMATFAQARGTTRNYVSKGGTLLGTSQTYGNHTIYYDRLGRKTGFATEDNRGSYGITTYSDRYGTITSQGVTSGGHTSYYDRNGRRLGSSSSYPSYSPREGGGGYGSGGGSPYVSPHYRIDTGFQPWIPGDTFVPSWGR